jgi:phosphoglycolate phosphatase-like HAD superfamily hydrolase
MRAAAILFDLDGTLVSTGGAGKRSLEQAVAEVTGVVGGVTRLRLDGMTDRAIVREAVRSGRPEGSNTCSEEEIDRVLERYLPILASGIATTEYRVLPQVAEQLGLLASRGLAVGLGTGNVEQGARIKLERGDLNRLLPFGGFGSDSEDRAQLLRTGILRASTLLGRSLDPAEVWIVGDTPKDIAAARAVGARVVAVATGGFSVQELESHRPDVTLPDLGTGFEELFR